MKKSITTTVIAVLAVLVMAGPVQSAVSKPEYQKPTSVTITNVDVSGGLAEVHWTASPYADFYTVKVAKNSEFKNAATYHDMEPNANGFAIDIENENTKPVKYWVKVAVSNYEGVRLSPYSTVKTFTVPAQG